MTRKPLESLSPEAQSIIKAQLSRRNVLLGAGGVGAAALLAACGTGGGSTSTEITPAKDLSDTEKVVNWANWTLYLDYDEKTKKYPTLEKFQQQTGIKATYAEDIDGNDSYYGKVQAQLKKGQDIGKDIITMTDWMAGRMIRQGFIQKLDKANIPNAGNILPALANVGFDQGRNYSLTWQSGFAGIAWNKKAVPQGIKSVADLWNPKLKGRVEVLDEMRDTMGILMMANGVDITKDFSSDDFMNALDVLQKQIDSGQIRQVKGNSYKEDLISGDALAVIGWSGDITQLNFENNDQWEFAIPDSGGTLWSDNMMIPIGSPHKKNAETLMNFYYDPAIAAEVAAYVNYISPVQGAKEEMMKIDPSLANDQLIFPNEETLANVKVFRPLSADEETEYSAAFQSAIGK